MSASNIFLHIELPDGTRTVFKGKSFGYGIIDGSTVCGEVVFQTGMVGYEQSLTDPSYHKQLLVLTYPLIGNYGVPHNVPKDEYGISLNLEDESLHPRALIVDEYIDTPSHWNSCRTLDSWLLDNQIIGISGIDTRSLTILIRDHGTLKGIISLSSELSLEDTKIQLPDMTNAVKDVTEWRKEPTYFGNSGGASTRVLVIDCGIKNNQLRLLLKNGKTTLIVVPYDFDFLNTDIKFDRLFISNGPGDPEDCTVLIDRLRLFMESHPRTPIFGICLGHQLLSLAAGFETYKLKYGNRGHNIPCSLAGTHRCFVTTQNHGFATNVESVQHTETEWRPLFTNLNDGSNEGLYHLRNPWFSVQFHPEAKGGPEDTGVLFDIFLSDEIVGGGCVHKLIIDAMGDSDTESQPPHQSPKKYEKVIVLGSGGLRIGQSGEFDYSGSQAIKAYREEGLNTILVNPNIATVQTSSDFVDKIYFLPVTPEFVEKIIHIERPDCIALSFGGQTALNCGAELYASGVLKKYGVDVLGTSVESIMKTEDRQLFKNHIESIGEKIPNGMVCTTIEDGVKHAAHIGYPVLVRSAFALGGLGSGFANDESELKPLLNLAFSGAKNPQAIIDKSFRGWKEIEYEIVRDKYGNSISVCNMENLDPLGVHTGESIVVAPSQTLSDEEYNLLRTTAVKVIESFGIVGECNIQYALDPKSKEYFIIEINARLSRSSALASKATGYPLAYIAAKLGLGYGLADLKNSITEKTSACFEPSLDYCVVKIPRWDLDKFERVTTKIDSAMKSVGEGMAISRTFEEALQKAVRMTGLSEHGLEPGIIECTDDELRNPTYKRILAIATGLYTGEYTVDTIHQLSCVDKWFLSKIKNIVDIHIRLEQDLYSVDMKDSFPIAENPELLLDAKVNGFSDKQIAHITKCTELFIRDLRYKFDIFPEVKNIDTVSGEFPCESNYLYSTYKDSPTWTRKKDPQKDTVLVLGSGVYKIGSSVEFDWCSVNCIRELRNLGKKVIMVNCNPETVSTDYDEADTLYFDELSFETVMDIHHIENPESVIVSVGGQIPNNIAMDLFRQNVNIIGTTPESIDRAENRFKFSRMLESLHVDQPEWKELTTFEEAWEFSNRVGYPCLVRPSYVLSGAAMNVAYSDDDLECYLRDAVNVRVSTDHPVVITKFIQDAKEIEVDAVSDNGWVKLIAISEHVENAGVHSGDATLILPPQDLTESTIKKIKKSVYKISQELKINGPFNIQFIAKDDCVKVIECNLRVSRSFPFVSKTLGTNFIKVATRIMLGLEYDSTVAALTDRIGVKVPQFSFNRLKGADILLNVEMKSTGEVACFGKDKREAYLKGLIATTFRIPPINSNILLSIGSYEFKGEFEESARTLQRLGFKLFGTHNTSNFMRGKGITVQEIMYDSTTTSHTIFNRLTEQFFSLVINVSERNKMRSDEDVSKGYQLRRLAVESDIPIFTDIKNAKLLIQSLDWYRKQSNTIAVNPDIDCFTSYKTVRLPGLIDVHVHVRDPGETYKEDWSSCSKAALSGGITTIFAMPNTNPSVCDEETFDLVNDIASANSYCDYGLYVGANSTNSSELLDCSQKAAALKMYLNNTHGPLLLESCLDWEKHLQAWSPDGLFPICVHAEAKTLGAILFMAKMYSARLHVCHVSTEEEINLVKIAKEDGMNVTCEVCPHHLFLADEDVTPELAKVKPPLARRSDIQALWSNMDIIDCFATDHAPHTLDDKRNGCPGFAGLETALPLLLTAVHDKRLTLNDIVLRYYTNPKRIFNIPDEVTDGSYIEVDCDTEWTIPEKMPFSKCGWTPFAGKKVHGCVKRVVLRDQPVYIDGNVIGKKGYGINIRTDTPLCTQRKRLLSTMLPEPTRDVAVSSPKLKLDNVIDVSQFTRDSLKDVFDLTDELRRMEDTQRLEILKGKILGLLFYEASTRTRCSFESAVLALGGKSIHVSSAKSSVNKGETLEDTLRSVECFCDAIVLRHPENDSAERGQRVLGCPLINAGAGSNSHPTQALLDAYTIRNEIGTLGGICVTFVGDLKYGRTVHSLIKLLAVRDNIRIRFISPTFLNIPTEIEQYLKQRGIEFSYHNKIEDVIETTDVLYVTRIQKERLNADELRSYITENVEYNYRVTPATLANAKPPREMCILHPLPRTTEISKEVDSDPRAAYFRQMKNGLYVRMALLKMIL